MARAGAALEAWGHKANSEVATIAPSAAAVTADGLASAAPSQQRHRPRSHDSERGTARATVPHSATTSARTTSEAASSGAPPNTNRSPIANAPSDGDRNSRGSRGIQHPPQPEVRDGACPEHDRAERRVEHPALQRRRHVPTSLGQAPAQKGRVQQRVRQEQGHPEARPLARVGADRRESQGRAGPEEQARHQPLVRHGEGHRGSGDPDEGGNHPTMRFGDRAPRPEGTSRRWPRRRWRRPDRE